MRLKNKKTGEIIILIDHTFDDYNSLAEFNEDWEDYEEPKEYWTIDWTCTGVTTNKYSGDDVDDFNEAIGNYFETKKEAEKAVEKLKAWKRLKDKGFDFVGCFKDNTINFEFVERPLDYDEAEEAEQDLAFLFGGEE